MILSTPDIVQRENQVFHQVTVESPKGSSFLWYSVEEPFGGLLSHSCDAALVGLLIPAMACGEDIHIRGAVSERLLYNLSGPCQSVLRYVMPRLRPIRVTADTLSPSLTPRPAGVATGFSGGIDSYCVLADNLGADTLPGFRITHLLFNNVGSHGKDNERMFHARFEHLAPSARRLGLPFVKVDSNLGSFFGNGLGFTKTHTFRNASVALLLQGGIGRYLYASAFNYQNVFVGLAREIAYTDSISLPLLSTDTLDAFSAGSEYTRVEKTVRVADFAESYGTLDVCINSHQRGTVTNCSACPKCLRTLATLDIAGLLERYSAVFDLEAYRRQKNVYFAELLAIRNPFHREIIAFARRRGYPLPIASRILHLLRFPSLSRFFGQISETFTGPPTTTGSSGSSVHNPYQSN
ncbi:hypothetical protein [Pelobacter propionicus]|uniref:Uncharacterized protein n=1 Tax=Pelobacter propionicus (strain DSM 2379 / NBRC 103807 / OttBd1) TaxID=338966 RepID=A1ASN5_PELPD|nr:hypothetical protein [Pelobacter propionicus]ABL00356.1 hypothetical protein Ppro_2756 [Pelobacter propionicus DSM 2379]